VPEQAAAGGRDYIVAVKEFASAVLGDAAEFAMSVGHNIYENTDSRQQG
jgi:hypothetical protein